jgi:hypothetical protein
VKQPPRGGFRSETVINLTATHLKDISQRTKVSVWALLGAQLATETGLAVGSPGRGSTGRAAGYRNGAGFWESRPWALLGAQLATGTELGIGSPGRGFTGCPRFAGRPAGYRNGVGCWASRPRPYWAHNWLQKQTAACWDCRPGAFLGVQLATNTGASCRALLGAQLATEKKKQRRVESPGTGPCWVPSGLLKQGPPVGSPRKRLFLGAQLATTKKISGVLGVPGTGLCLGAQLAIILTQGPAVEGPGKGLYWAPSWLLQKKTAASGVMGVPPKGVAGCPAASWLLQKNQRRDTEINRGRHWDWESRPGLYWAPSRL